MHILHSHVQSPCIGVATGEQAYRPIIAYTLKCNSLNFSLSFRYSISFFCFVIKCKSITSFPTNCALAEQLDRTQVAVDFVCIHQLVNTACVLRMGYT